MYANRNSHTSGDANYNAVVRSNNVAEGTTKRIRKRGSMPLNAHLIEIDWASIDLSETQAQRPSIRRIVSSYRVSQPTKDKNNNYKTGGRRSGSVDAREDSKQIFQLKKINEMVLLRKRAPTPLAMIQNYINKLPNTPKKTKSDPKILTLTRTQKAHGELMIMVSDFYYFQKNLF